MCDKLAGKVNSIDTNVFILNTSYSTGKLGIEKKINDCDKKIPDTTELVKKTDYNVKIT